MICRLVGGAAICRLGEEGCVGLLVSAWLCVLLVWMLKAIDPGSDTVAVDADCDRGGVEYGKEGGALWAGGW